jgi:hypothetical protein
MSCRFLDRAASPVDCLASLCEVARMAAGLEQHPLAVTEILASQVVGFCPLKHRTLADLGYHRTSGCAP